jgi:hypothetical protein
MASITIAAAAYIVDSHKHHKTSQDTSSQDISASPVVHPHTHHVSFLITCVTLNDNSAFFQTRRMIVAAGAAAGVRVPERWM